MCLFVLFCVHVFRYGLLGVPEVFYLIKNYCEVVFLSKISFKMCCELHLSDSVIPTVTYKLIHYYVRCRMYEYLLSWLFVYVFVTQLGKITINDGNHQNIAFH